MASLRELMQLTEGCKKNKGKKKSLKKVNNAKMQEATLEALETMLEMVEENALTIDETKNLTEAIEEIFNNVLEEAIYVVDAQETDYDDYYEDDDYDEDEDEDDDYDYDEDDDYYECTECEWSGSELDLDQDANCPECGAEVEKIPELEDDEEEMNEPTVNVSGVKWDTDHKEDLENLSNTVTLTLPSDYPDMDKEELSDWIEKELSNEFNFAHNGWESHELNESMTLNKTTAKQRMQAKKYRNSASGKKAAKLVAKKRKKYATKISRCSGKGKTFSLKTMSCVKSKKRR